MKECTNCDWKGEELSKLPLEGKCPTCGDEVKGSTNSIKKEEEESINLDLNNDGKVDSKDKSIAGKVLASGRRKRNKR